MIKRLILGLDGTWNTADAQEITNIVRIRDLICSIRASNLARNYLGLGRLDPDGQ